MRNLNCHSAMHHTFTSTLVKIGPLTLHLRLQALKEYKAFALNLLRKECIPKCLLVKSSAACKLFRQGIISAY